MDDRVVNDNVIEKGRKQFFFEKKNQKTFTPKHPAREAGKDAKVFCFFFKKEVLPSFLESFGVTLPYPGKAAARLARTENMLLLLPSWAEAGSVFAELVAACCAHGRPPFVAVLGDGAPDGSQHQARRCEATTRQAMSVLGLPKDRLLFVGIRQGKLPMPKDALFSPLKAAMVQLSWRQDCNLIAACHADTQQGDVAAAWVLACAMAEGLGLPMIAAANTAKDDLF